MREKAYKMKIEKLFFYLLLFSLVLNPFDSYASDIKPSANIVLNSIHYQHVVWNGIPISFVVPVGDERILSFPGRVSFHNTNPKLTTDKITVENNDGKLYFVAKKSFVPIRLSIVDKRTGKVILVDLSATRNADDTPVSVLLGGALTPLHHQALAQSKPQFIGFVALTRYAIQHLYSPLRLVKQNAAISRFPMYTTRSINLFDDGSAMAMPLVSWRGGDLYVTAVLLKNVGQSTKTLDPRALNGNWLAASFYPSNKLFPTGTKGDRTTLFLISNEPFNESLNQGRGYRL